MNHQWLGRWIEVILNGLIFRRGLKNFYNQRTKRDINPYFTKFTGRGIEKWAAARQGYFVFHSSSIKS